MPPAWTGHRPRIAGSYSARSCAALAIRIAANIRTDGINKFYRHPIRSPPPRWASTPRNTRRSLSAPRPCLPRSPARSRPSSSVTSRLRVTVYFFRSSAGIGSAVGGIATIGGAIVGGLFIEFVPNLANDISDAAPWAIYGLAMLFFMYIDAARRCRHARALPHAVLCDAGRSAAPFAARRSEGA